MTVHDDPEATRGATPQEDPASASTEGGGDPTRLQARPEFDSPNPTLRGQVEAALARDLVEGAPSRIQKLVGDGWISASSAAAFLTGVLDWLREAAGRTGPRPTGSPGLEGSWGDYQNLSLVGEGAMGKVYRAYDSRLRRPVALKVLRHQEGEPYQRFLREAQAQSRVEHDHVCKVYAVGESEGQPYIAMQFIPGKTLRTAAQDLSRLDKVRLVRQAAEGLHAAHLCGLVHRDVKPSNILVEHRPPWGLRAYVTDFGLVRDAQSPLLTEVGQSLGTPAYMSPEQILGSASLDARSDIYSLGATLFELLAGRAPFMVQHGSANLLGRTLKDEAPRLRTLVDTPVDLESIVARCLEKEPDRRYPSALALAEDLDRFLDGRPVSARRTHGLYRLERWLGRNKVLAAGIFASALAILGLTGWGLWGRYQGRIQATLAADFSREAAESANALQIEYGLPSHDLSDARARARETLVAIEGKMAQLGAAAQGPGHTARGQLLLQLGEVSQACATLDQAWKDGYRTPSLRSALGEALSRDYLKELYGLTGKALEARRKELDQSHRQRAQSLLDPGSQGGDPLRAAYHQALLAYLEGDLPSTQARARVAQAAAPWLGEAWDLEVKALLAGSNEAFQRGDHAGAASLSTQARDVLDKARDMLRSHPLLGETQVRMAQRNLTLNVRTRQATAEDLARLDAALKASQALVPDDPQVLHLKSLGYMRWAEHLMGRGQDPSEALRVALQAGARGHELAPQDPAICNTLALAWWTRAEWEGEAGRDPRPSYDNAINFLQAMKAHGRWLDMLHQNLASCLVQRALIEENRGGNPLVALEQALGHAQSAVLEDRNFRSVGVLGWTQLHLGQAQRRWGLDPSQALDAGIESASRALAENPKYLVALQVLTTGATERSRWPERGPQGRPFLDRALEAAETGRRLYPEDADFCGMLMEIHRERALNGIDPRDSLTRARASHARARQLRPGSLEFTQDGIRLETTAIHLGLQSPERVLPGLERALDIHRRTRPEDATWWLLRGHLYRSSAQRTGRPDWAREARLSLDRAVALNPTLAHEATRLVP